MLGRSAGWVYQMQTYSRVRYTLKHDLGLGKSRAIGRLEPEHWRLMVYDGDHLRLHTLRDDRGAMLPDRKTIGEMTVREVERVVATLLSAQDPPTTVLSQVPPAAATDEAAPREYTQLNLPLDWDDVVMAPVERIRALRPGLDAMDPATAYDICVRTAPLFAEVTDLYRRARDRARQGGYEV